MEPYSVCSFVPGCFLLGIIQVRSVHVGACGYDSSILVAV